MEKMLSFKEFYNAGPFLNTTQTGHDNAFFGVKQPEIPMPSLDLPLKQVNGRVRRINYTENPISIIFDNGTTWNMTKKQWDYLKSTNKEPRINSEVQIEMFVDGTIKSVNFGGPGHHSESKDPVRGKETNLVSSVGGRPTGKPEKKFGRPSPF